MIEAGVVVGPNGPIYWHLPPGRTGGSIPDDRHLWQVLWQNKGLDGLGFAHSHPGAGIPGPSMTDLTTFAAVEAGLGRRLYWWIANSDQIVLLRWQGPDKLDYNSLVLEAVPGWANQLREYSNKETTNE